MNFLLYIPVSEEERTDVRHRRGRRPQLCQRHDVFKGDVGLSAHIHHMNFLKGAMGAAAGGPSDDLHHNGFLGTTQGLHCLLMAGLGQLLSIHLRKTENSLCELFHVGFLVFALEMFLESRVTMRIDRALVSAHAAFHGNIVSSSGPFSQTTTALANVTECPLDR